jgi:small acid-soluble spore protein D (minor alpha/beta-type SASP)
MDVQSRISNAKPLVGSGAQAALEKMKYETATELAINVPNGDYWGNVSSRDCGRVGGNMVRKLIAIAEQQIK